MLKGKGTMLKGKGLLSAAQRRFLRLFSKTPDSSHFYLTGGTALAEFYLGHRYSFDLDLFTVEPDLLTPFCRVLEALARKKRHPLQVIRRFETFVEYLYQSEPEFRIQLAVDSPFRFAPPIPTEYNVFVNDWDDISVDKLLAFYGRVEPRNAVDLYFILEREDPQHLLRKGAEKDPGFDRYWFAVACQQVASFPDEIERWGVQIIVPVEAAAIKSRLLELADSVMEELNRGN
jgi:hypothetical protein